ncbi:MAG: 1-(5-phosphoribosyl)-5-[(5-phosphoribosylamino)methylideneamino]imidazole-4-carboxamide isomerase [Bacteroidetes bacterium GWE2_29_8]|nr:MAG: 1-(5-phosphoribosyl)-5-[(5-phosphoribosylamino)methylideneamino]imidazole-4-carboxamide isomerase [Bacteroidetes bacterium GWE2_29_8]OFY14433.1 MAG: 1-(5-phosphoribosyl)-5-[(5-phosphoribosylamino)methylideneamino]imidazole-4-carboxamide isomerase [Bacteroidetes bacterium GWF2_29_10]
MINIFPAIDIIDGKCVRLTKGDYNSKKIYEYSPLDMSKFYEDNGYKFLHLVDLDGARLKRPQNLRVLEKIATQTKLEIDFGGGIRNEDDMRIVYDSGATKVNIGSLAVEDKEKIEVFLKWFGRDYIIISSDSKDRKIKISGWQEEGGVEIFDFVEEMRELGIQYFSCTDIDKDGMLNGISIDFYRELMERNPTSSIIASGGVSNIDEIHALDKMGVFGVIIGKAFYEGKINPKELAKEFKLC